MTEPLLWVIGGSGLLGSHLRRILPQQVAGARVWQPQPPRFSWTNPVRLAEEIGHAVETFAATIRAGNHTWVLLWCAGKGVMSSLPAALESEWSAWVQLLDLLGRRLGGVPGSIFLASSAGGVYDSSPEEPLTERTLVAPVSAYGKHKLRMEDTLRNWTDSFPEHSSLIGRISSLYGPGQDLRKAQGIISHLSRCLIYHRPVNIYVSLDTRRDYLFIDDCAHQVAANLLRVMNERHRVVLKIFASEEVTSLARITGIFFRMAKRRPLIVSSQPRRSTQPTSLKFRSDFWRDLKVPKTDLATGIYLVHEYQLGLFRQGLLPAAPP